MRKLFLTILLMGAGLQLSAQNEIPAQLETEKHEMSYTAQEEKNLEQAYFLVKQKGEDAYSTVIELIDTPISSDDYLQLKREMYSKDGIFLLERFGEGKFLRVYHLSYIDIETIKSFVTPFHPDFHPHEKEPYLFQ